MISLDTVNKIITFARERGQDLAPILRGFIRRHPELVDEGHEAAPPPAEPTVEDIDAEIDELIEDGEL